MSNIENFHLKQYSTYIFVQFQEKQQVFLCSLFPPIPNQQIYPQHIGESNNPHVLQVYFAKHVEHFDPEIEDTIHNYSFQNTYE